MRVTDLDLDLEIVEIPEDEETSDPGPQPDGGQAPGVAWGRTGQDPAAKLAAQSIRSRISRTRSIEVCGCRNANLATVSPSHADGGMKAT